MTANEIWKQMQSMMCALYARWQDEGRYENFVDYQDMVDKKVTALGGEFRKMTKRPFAVDFAVDGALWQLRVTSRQYRLARLTASV